MSRNQRFRNLFAGYAAEVQEQLPEQPVFASSTMKAKHLVGVAHEVEVVAGNPRKLSIFSRRRGSR